MGDLLSLLAVFVLVLIGIILRSVLAVILVIVLGTVRILVIHILLPSSLLFAVIRYSSMLVFSGFILCFT